MGLTYAKSGVDIDAKSKAIATLVKEVSFQRKGLGAPVDIGGHFAGLIDFGENYLSLCTDGVGTKLLVAEALGKWDTVGIDCIAMNANDMICVGAEPLAFVDYIALNRPAPAVVAAIGIAARMAGGRVRLRSGWGVGWRGGIGRLGPDLTRQRHRSRPILGGDGRQQCSVWPSEPVFGQPTYRPGQLAGAGIARLGLLGQRGAQHLT